MSKFDPEKLKALQQKKTVKIGGQRVKKAVATTKETSGNDRKVANAVQKLGARSVPVTELNFFHESSPNVTTFTRPKATVAPQANTWLFSGKSTTRPITELFPGILNHLGIENLAALRDTLGAAGGMPPGVGLPGTEDVPNFDEVADDEEAPELVE